MSIRGILIAIAIVLGVIVLLAAGTSLITLSVNQGFAFIAIAVILIGIALLIGDRGWHYRTHTTQAP
jgi:hypothetical protein